MTENLRKITHSASAFVVVVVLALTAVAPVQASGTKGELAAAKAKLNDLLDKIEDANARIDSIQDEMNAIASRINSVQGRIAQAQNKIASVQREIVKAEQRLRATQRQLDRRAAVAYQNGPGTGLDFLLGSKSLADLNDRLQIINRAASSDQDLINEIQDRKNQLNIKRFELEKLEDELRAQESDLREQDQALQDKFAQQQDELEAVESQKAEAAALVEKLEEKLAEQRRAAEIAREKARLAALEREKEEAARAAAEHTHDSGGDTQSDYDPPVSGGGPFRVCPVDPPRAYSDDFGAPRVGHTHQGNDIFAPYGTPVRAPFSGTASSSNSSLGGLSVYVYGSQGYVYNAHLSGLGTLGSVSAGTIIGYVGDSGNAQGSSPHNHFEWHPGNGAAVNPFPYLNMVC